jgi:integrase/recombinase XerD
MDIEEITEDHVIKFLDKITEGCKPHTKRGRFSYISALFNFIQNNHGIRLDNPCDKPLIKKLYRPKCKTHWDIIDKETVDEIIFRTTKIRDRLMLELMARGGMRVGEVLKLTLADIHDQKLILQRPKSGKEQEVVFVTQKLAERLKDYAVEACKDPKERIFPISYETARAIVHKAGNIIGVELRPHDLRRHSATYASRSGVPIEIVSKIILRHANLSTTQEYLGKISDDEALRWIETLYR